jgi:hypothetical protein
LALEVVLLPTQNAAASSVMTEGGHSPMERGELLTWAPHSSSPLLGTAAHQWCSALHQELQLQRKTQNRRCAEKPQNQKTSKKMKWRENTRKKESKQNQTPKKTRFSQVSKVFFCLSISTHNKNFLAQDHTKVLPFNFNTPQKFLGGQFCSRSQKFFAFQFQHTTKISLGANFAQDHTKVLPFNFNTNFFGC